MRLIDADAIFNGELLLVSDKAYDAVHAVIERINNAPTVDPVKHGHWIPVTERLPEVNGRYLVTRGLNACGSLWERIYIANYSDLMGLKSKRIWWQGNVGKSDFERLDDVVAWMPLPKPYKGERKEDETN